MCDPRRDLVVLPKLMQQLASNLTAEQQRAKPEGQPLSFHEHAWHLADLEREGFGVRLHRLLHEDAPQLPDFDGERVARERDYASLPPELGLAVFVAARAQMIDRLEAMTPAERQRAGEQENVGRITAGELPERIWSHDRSHARELVELLEVIAPKAAELVSLREIAHAKPS